MNLENCVTDQNWFTQTSIVYFGLFMLCFVSFLVFVLVLHLFLVILSLIRFQKDAFVFDGAAICKSLI